jgi:hypothetical protein
MAHGERAQRNKKDLWGKRPNKFIMPRRSPFTKKITRRMERKQGRRIANDGINDNNHSNNNL